jgi:hypothetical protein
MVFESMTPVFDQAKIIHALDHTATVIGNKEYIFKIYSNLILNYIKTKDMEEWKNKKGNQ